MQQSVKFSTFSTNQQFPPVAHLGSGKSRLKSL
jgi:hypothetical protein